MPERFALYFAPPVASPLWRRASQWLGRDAADGTVYHGDCAGLERSWLAARTESARRYGFHATLKPPMALAPGNDREGLERALAAFASARERVLVGGVHLQWLDGFLALMPQHETGALSQLAADCVVHFEPFRAPLADADRERRATPGLTDRQAELLERFGYPFVLDQFRFHMTLTDRIAPGERAPIEAAARDWFGPLLQQALMVDSLSLYHEAGRGAPFTRIADMPLGQEALANG